MTCLNCSKYWICNFQFWSISCKKILFSISLYCSSFNIFILSSLELLNLFFIFSSKALFSRLTNSLISLSSNDFPNKDFNCILISFDPALANFFVFFIFKSSIISSRKFSEYCLESLFSITSFLCENITCLWSFKTLSNFKRVFLISKFLASTFCCALSNALFIQGWSILSPSLSPSFSSILFIDSDPNILIKSSSKLT